MAVGRFVARDGAFVARLDAAERDVLADVVEQVVELLGGVEAADAGPFRMGVAPIAPPEDPALLRLLPDGSKADPEVAAEFRRLTEADLRATKVTNLLRLRDAVVGAGPRLVVEVDAAPGLVAAFTDVRLVLAERLGIRTEADAEALDDLLATAVADTRVDDDTGSTDDAGDGTPDTDDAPGPPGVDPDLARTLFLASVYDVLGLLQDSLVELMLDALPDGDDPEPAPSSR